MLAEAIAKAIERECPFTDEVLSVTEIQKIAEVAVMASHTYMLGAAECVSNTGRPYLDNNYGRCALEILRQFDPQKASDIVSESQK